MASAVVAKKSKKQTSKSDVPRELEQALLALESACMYALDSQFSYEREDVEGMMWQRKFKNLVNPVSLALREYKGPRHFHNHYRHNEKDDSILEPVLDDPLETLSRVCQSALNDSQSSFGGLHDKEITASRSRLEQALRKFLAHYREYKK